MKAFTFLGRGPLYKSNYIFENQVENQECETHFFAEAIVQFFSPESLYIFATDSAAREPVSKENTTERLEHITKLLSKKTQVKPITIKEGSDETELWDIFESVVDNINDNDTVLFDITHGFRSLPFLTFLALAYVSNVKSDVTIEKVIYGAYEAVERENPNKPVFDLTPFVSLLKWMNAVNVFQNYGDARPIAELGMPNSIKRILDNMSAALLTNRTFEAQQTIHTFINMDLMREESLSRQPVPFQILAEKLKESYKPLGVKKPSENQLHSLRAQYQQIKWYIGNQHYLQAITLMREWIVSWECIQTNKGDWLSKDSRKKAEDTLNELIENNQMDKREYTQLWRLCRDFRNDLAHCGMRKDPRRAQRTITTSKNIFNGFEAFVKKNSGLYNTIVS